MLALHRLVSSRLVSMRDVVGNFDCTHKRQAGWDTNACRKTEGVSEMYCNVSILASSDKPGMTGSTNRWMNPTLLALPAPSGNISPPLSSWVVMAVAIVSSTRDTAC